MGPRAYVVRTYRPWLTRLIAVTLLAVAVTAGYALHEAGYARGRAEFLDVRVERDALQAANRQAREELRVLRGELDALERSAAINEDAYQQVRTALVQQQGELHALREELVFYRSVAVSTEEGRGLAIQSLQLVADEREQRGYRYAVVLTRISRSDKLTRGQLELAVLGSRAGQALRMDLAALGGAAPGTEFQFRHFLRLRGRLQLPEDFVPAQVVVAVTAGEEGGERTSIERSFEWPGPAG